MLVAMTAPPEQPSAAPAHDRLPVWFQRVENAALAAAALAAFVDLGFSWWWLLALFLLFDVSMVGYARDPRLGAWTYNAVHSYLGPGGVAVAGIASGARWAMFLALTWAFHIGVDRLLGYGLKFRDRFTHTHLGEVGRSGGRHR
jgi:hypothetical protein